jgi:hypothetical protein
MIKNKQKLTFGVFYRSSASAPVELNSTHTSLMEAERESSKLFDELVEALTWPGFHVWVEPVDTEGTPTMTWCFDNTTLHL